MFKIKKPLVGILALSAVVRMLYLLLDYPLWWDSHVYVSIGKYIFSQGTIGSWESFRPLVHPFLLGALWKLGLNPLVFGKILDLIFSLLAVFLVYRLTQKIFDQGTAILAALLFSLTPLFVIYTGLLLTEPLALVLGLAGLLVLLKPSLPRIVLSGVLLGLSFLTRFPQGIWLAAVTLAWLSWERKKEAVRSILLLTGGFLLPVIPYLLFNLQRYGNIWEPFVAGSWIVTTSTWLYGSGFAYYLREFWWRNPVYFFSFPYLYFFFREKLWSRKEQLILFLIPLLSIAYFLYLPRKESRYLVTSLPFLAMMAAYSIKRIYFQLKNSSTPLLKPYAFIAILLLLLLAPMPMELHFERPPSFTPELQDAVQTYQINGTILSSDPSFVSFLDQRIVTLDGMAFAPIVYGRYQGQYQLLFINDCDLPCPPKNQSCEIGKRDFLGRIGRENKEIFKKVAKNCSYGIYLPR